MKKDVYLVNVSRTYKEGMNNTQIRTCAEGDWRANMKKAQDVNYVVPILNGVGIAVYEVTGEPIISTNGRIKFPLTEARDEVQRRFLNRSFGKYFTTKYV